MTSETPAPAPRLAQPERAADDHSIVVIDKFIQATRDSGYKGTASAIAELVDNSIQAGADTIEITIAKDGDDSAHPLTVTIADDGEGMPSPALRQALRFGGSSRFGDRGGLGRYGMGLPNSSLSQARRVTVTTWTKPSYVCSSYLDVDEIARGLTTQVPAPKRCRLPDAAVGDGAHGTVVEWTRCDRLDNRRASTLARKLDVALGRRFRCFLFDGLELTINGDPVTPVDPLYLHPDGRVTGGALFDAPLTYEVAASEDDPDRTGHVTVTFSELPVEDWHDLSNDEKRRRGVAKGAGVSVVRGQREVDHGWFFMGGKRRENYDDWWRCEVRFEPELDEAFGITHTKQQIRPKAYVLEALTPDLEETARLLNKRARDAYLRVKQAQQPAAPAAAAAAAAADAQLPPVPPTATKRDRELMTALRERHGAAADGHQVVVAPVQGPRATAPLDYAREGGKVAVIVNQHHPFYKEIYAPLLEVADPAARSAADRLQFVLLALGRVAACAAGDKKKIVDRYLADFGAALRAMLEAPSDA